MNFEESNSMPRKSILQVFSDWGPEKFEGRSDIPRQFYPEDLEGTGLYELIGNSKMIALDRIEKIEEIQT